MSITADDTIRAVGSFYQAAFEPERWPEALDNLRRMFDGAVANIFVADAHTGEFPVWLSAGADPGQHEYVDEVCKIDPRIPLSINLRSGDVVYDYRLLPEEVIRRDPFYDWLRRLDLQYFMGTRLFDNGSINAYAAINWTPRQGHVTEIAIASFERLVPHLMQAVRLTVETETLKTSSAVYQFAADQLDFGIAAIDRSGRVMFTNAKAEEILVRGDGLSLQDGELRAFKSADTRGLHQAIADLLAADATTQPGTATTYLVARRGTTKPYAVSVSPAPPSPIGNAAAGAAALIVIRDPSTRTFDTITLRDLFGLTPREAELAAELASGAPLPAAARRLGMAPNTARVHLQAIFRKTGARSQVELVALLSGYSR